LPLVHWLLLVQRQVVDAFCATSGLPDVHAATQFGVTSAWQCVFASGVPVPLHVPAPVPVPVHVPLEGGTHLPLPHWLSLLQKQLPLAES
jgi:hypothetical protein